MKNFSRFIIKKKFISVDTHDLKINCQVDSHIFRFFGGPLAFLETRHICLHTTIISFYFNLANLQGDMGNLEVF